VLSPAGGSATIRDGISRRIRPQETRLSTGPVRASRRIRGCDEAPRRHDQYRAASALLVGWVLVARALVERPRASAEVGCVGLDEPSELGQFGGQGIRI